MATRLEDKIRDFLATNLHFISSGLRLIEKEFVLPNPAGTGGRIDLLARDEFGVFVVIEIKRSDQAARQALSEIFKYTGLFRNNQGLDETRIRVAVVSTEWNELRLPLAEYAAVSPYLVEGIHISANSNGEVTCSEKVDLSQNRAPLAISRCHGIYFFGDTGRREAFVNALEAGCEQCGIADFLIFSCDYSGLNPQVIYPFGAYLCFSSPLAEISEAALQETRPDLEWETGLDEPDENFFVNLSRYIGHDYDEFSVAYPEKLAGLKDMDWTMKVLRRAGRLNAQSSLTSDDEMLALAAAIEGGANDYLQVFLPPRHTARWEKLQQDMELVLFGNDAWAEVVPLVLAEIAASSPLASVSVSVYNPANMVVVLARLAVGMHPTLCAPSLEIVVDDPETQTLRVVNGFLCENRPAILSSPAHVLNSIYGDIHEWTMINHVHLTHEYEERALYAHGLTTVTSEWKFTRNATVGPRLLFSKDAELSREDFPSAYSPLPAWIAKNRAYLKALRTLVEDNFFGFQ